MSADLANLAALLSWRAAGAPDGVAFRFVDDQGCESALTYGELDNRARRVASGLISEGLRGERVVLWQPTGFDFLAALFGTFYASAIAVPLTPTTSARGSQRLQALLADVDPGALLTTRSIHAATAEIRARLPFLRARRFLCTEDLEACTPIEGAVAAPADEVAVIQYTSGSTSAPKGVQVTHGNFLRNARLVSAALDLGPADTGLTWLPLFHDMGLIAGVMTPLLQGLTNILMQPASFVRRPASWLQMISRHRVTATAAPNFAFDLCVDRVSDAELETLDLSSWRIGLCGAEPVRARTMERFAQRFAPYGFARGTIIPAYGLAEATLFVSASRREDGPRLGGPAPSSAPSPTGVSIGDGEPVPRFVSCGPPHAEQELLIVDPDRGIEKPPGEIGEIWLSGPHVAAGYWRKPELTQATFHARSPARPGVSFLRTGDLGFMDQGELFVAGRLKDLILIRGANHYPQDIEETAIASHAALAGAMCAAFTVDVDDDARLVVVCELHRSARRDASEAASAIRRQVAEEHGVQVWEVVLVGQGAVPKTSSGKVQRGAARDLFLAGELPAISGQAATTKPVGKPTPRDAEAAMMALWAKVLGHDRFGATDNFFEIGGDSLRLAALHEAVAKQFGGDLTLAEIFDHPTPAALAKRLAGGAQGHGRARRSRADPAAPIAIVGMACRFPDAPDVSTFWSNIQGGVTSIRKLDPEALRAAGVRPEELADPAYVPALASIPEARLFDADYFGYSRAEAAWMDPQHRVLLECAVEALEQAACDPGAFAGRISIHAGGALNLSQLRRLLARAAERRSPEHWLALLGSDKDYLASRIAYKLGLRGPAVTVQTACSTSLVAVHLACQSLRSGDSDLALAGGVSITNDGREVGYRWTEGDVFSPDGAVRPFDARAAGTVFGDGAGLVALKRLDDALADRDTIRAVIRGSAINNDGSTKVGFTAPSAAGQAAVVRDALEQAGLGAETIGYVEAHGTGTLLGDPIEISGLQQAFGRTGHETPCAIGSLKANVGHLNAAAGVAGLIKAALVVEQGYIPPNPGFASLNPHIDLADARFAIPSEGCAWTSEQPRRAGVSAFGFGGTNAHVVLEEAPRKSVERSRRAYHILAYSARTSGSLDRTRQRLAQHLRDHPEIDLGDVAHTLAVGRPDYRHREAIVCGDPAEALAALEAPPQQRLRGEAEVRSTLFMFPGQGAQRPGMGAVLHRTEPVFREALDLCAERLSGRLPADLRELMFDTGAGSADRLNQTAIAQPALFAYAYALAKQWMAWGLTPHAMIGHSIGEYVAATLSGVFDIDQALDVVATRGRLMQDMAPGAMLTVNGSPSELRPLCDGLIGIAAYNAPRMCVLSGPVPEIAELQAKLERRGLSTIRLRTSHAFHSPMMATAAEGLTEALRRVRLSPPALPFISNVTGQWITPDEATSPEYWGRQLLSPVRFADGLTNLLAGSKAPILLEVGAGRALSGLAGLNGPGMAQAVASSPGDVGVEVQALHRAAAEVWAAGGGIKLDRLYDGETRRRVPLPTYPFEHQSFDHELPSEPADLPTARPPSELPLGIYAPGWTRIGPRTSRARLDGEQILVVAPDVTFTGALSAALRNLGADVRWLRLGAAPGEAADPLSAGIADVLKPNWKPSHLVCFWPPATDRPIEGPRQAWGLHGLYDLLQGLGSLSPGLQLIYLAANSQNVLGIEPVNPSGALGLGPCLTLPAEASGVRARFIDLDHAEMADAPEDLARALALDLAAGDGNALTAYRLGCRWNSGLHPVQLPPASEAVTGDAPVLRRGGVYLITGGLGGLGLAVAASLWRSAGAKLALISRNARRTEADDEVAGRVGQLRDEGAEILVLEADVADPDALRTAVRAAEAALGPIAGVVHSAGVLAPRMLMVQSQAERDATLRPKLGGLEAMAQVFSDRPLDLLVLFSSLSAVSGQPGLGDYGAANAYLDAFAAAPAPSWAQRVVSINWDAWREVGMASAASVPAGLEAAKAAALATGLSTAEGCETHLRILASGYSRVVVTRGPSAPAPARPPASVQAPAVRSPRPELAVPFAPPQTELERQVADVLARVLNLEVVGLDDDFFELGGHSLLGMQLVSDLRDTLGIDVPLKALFEAPTIRTLAAFIPNEEWESVDL